MASLHLCKIIEGIHARMAELPAENKTDKTILPILFEQIAAEYQRLKDQEDQAKHQLQEKLDAITKREEARDTSKPSRRSGVVRTLRKDKRDSKSRKSARDNDRKMKRREVAEEQNFGEEDVAHQQAEQKQERMKKVKKSRAKEEEENAFLKSMKEARDEAVREQAEAEQLEKKEAYLQSMKEARDEAIREQAEAERLEIKEAFLKASKELRDKAVRGQTEAVLAMKDRALRQQAYEALKALCLQLEDEKIARRYDDGDQDEEKEDGQVGGAPLPSALKLDDEEQESEECDLAADPWEDLFQEIIDEATLIEVTEKEARRAIRERQEEWLEPLRKQLGDEEIARRWNEGEDEEVAFEGAAPKPQDKGVPLFSDAEIEQQKQKEAFRKQEEEELKAPSQQFDEDELARRWNEAEEEEEQEGVPLPGTLRPEDEGVPLFSQPTMQSRKTSSSDEETTSNGDSSSRSRSSSASSATSTNTTLEPETKPEANPRPEQPVPSTQSSTSTKPRVTNQPFHPAVDKSQPRGSRYPTLPLHGNKRNRGSRVAEDHIAKRRFPRTSTFVDPNVSTMPEVRHLGREDMLEYLYHGAYFKLQEGDDTSAGRKVYVKLGRDHGALFVQKDEDENENEGENIKSREEPSIFEMTNVKLEKNEMPTHKTTKIEPITITIPSPTPKHQPNIHLTLLPNPALNATNKHATAELKRLQQIWVQGLEILILECGWGIADGIGKEEKRLPMWMRTVYS